MTILNNPQLGLLVKLGSLAVHVRELLSGDGHHFDRVAIGSLINDPEVVAALGELGEHALLPVMRSER